MAFYLLHNYMDFIEFLTEIIKDNFVEKKSYRESVKTRKKIENYLKIER